MNGKSWRAYLLASLFAFVVLCGTRAEDTRPADAGKAENFKSKAFDLKEKGKAAVTLAFPAGKKATLTVRSEKETDIHLFVYDSAKKVIAKDVSPGPSCDLTFTPKEAGKYNSSVALNKGPAPTVRP